MIKALQAIAILLAVGTVVFWLATGANRGWTKTSREVRTLDEITGIEGISYEPAFLPGRDFLAGGLLGAGALGGIAMLIRKRTKNQNRKTKTLTT